MAKPDLVFITKANEAFLKERAEALGKQLPADTLDEKTIAEDLKAGLDKMKESAEAKAPKLSIVGKDRVKTE